MTYWLNLFTGTTWREFQDAGAKVSGHRERVWARAKDIRPGDLFLCYLVGVKRWVGLLEIKGERFRDETGIFEEGRTIGVSSYCQSRPQIELTPFRSTKS
jgi:hypothetical protein